MTDAGSEDDPLLGRLADEFLGRYRRGEHPPLTDYTRRHPELAERIRDLLAAVWLGPPSWIRKARASPSFLR